jgi:hypothetical protein
VVGIESPSTSPVEGQGRHSIPIDEEVFPMAEAKVGDQFITHELDEAIAIQRSIVQAEESLGRDHPSDSTKEMILEALKQDQQFLRQLEELGRPMGATGKSEEVASALEQLATQTTQSAAEASSEAYEAHAVLLNLKRKQQDSAAAMVKIARATKNTKMGEAATKFEKETKASAQALSKELAALAVEIATQGREMSRTGSRGGSSRSGSSSSGSRSSR